MGAAVGKPSRTQTWIRSQSKGFQKHAVEAQNFFKHGFKDLKGKTSYFPLHGEMLMFDSVMCYKELFDTITPLMRLYAARLSLARRGMLTSDAKAFLLKRGVGIDNIAESDRTEFLENSCHSSLSSDRQLHTSALLRFTQIARWTSFPAAPRRAVS